MSGKWRAAGGACLACMVLAAGTSTAQNSAARAGASYMTPGLSAEQLARLPGVTYARPLQWLPERTYVVVHLDFPPKRGAAAPQQGCAAHRHAGPATVRVTKGVMRLGLAGQRVRIVRAGEVFYEPANAIHTVAESASNTEPAAAIASLVLPRGAPLLTPVNSCGGKPS